VANRWFTPDTARLALDDLRPAAETLCRLYRELECVRPARILSDQPVDRVYFDLVSRLHATLHRIRRRGVSVHDLRRGRLGFPARRAGRQVVLCWQVGEATLGFWHEPEAGPDGRRPVDEDGPWEED
jgi:hypothetical protein